VDAPLASWPDGYRDLYLTGRFEEDEVALWRKNVEPGGVVVDGGANLGFWTLVAAGFVGSRGRVYAFEPHPLTFGKLQASVTASGTVDTCQLAEAALGAQDASASIFTVVDNPSGACASFHRNTECSWDEVTQVPVRSLDSYFKEYGEPSRLDLVKLDLEGSELAALHGMQQTLDRYRPKLSIEWNEVTATAAGFHPSELLDFLAPLGFEPFLNEGGELSPFKTPTIGASPMIWFVHRSATA
jgi:FkbM family methyltransferase